MTISTEKIPAVETRPALPLPERQPEPAAREKAARKAEERGQKQPDAERLKLVLAEADISLNFRRDDATGTIVVELIDNSTGNAVRQIPSEVSLRLAEMFSKVQGQFFEFRV